MYTSDLTDTQWERIRPLLTGYRTYKWSKRILINAVLYVNRTGCQWRNLPKDFPPYKTVYMNWFICQAIISDNFSSLYAILREINDTTLFLLLF